MDGKVLNMLHKSAETGWFEHPVSAYHNRSVGEISMANFATGNASPVYRHGHSAGGKTSPTYRSWVNMLNRCYRPGSKNYEYWGGKGVRVIARWHQFENFLADMGERPDGLTLDRIDSDGDYEPGNCQWTTPKEQARVRRKAVVRSDGKVYISATDAARDINRNPSCVIATCLGVQKTAGGFGWKYVGGDSAV